VLTAAGATGQLIFLPVLAALAQSSGWRTAALTVTGAALAVVPLVLWLLPDHPADLGIGPYGEQVVVPPPPRTIGAARRTVTVLARASRTSTFWLLAGGFAICGASTNGLIATHLIPAAHDHGMPETTAAGLLALVGLFDIAGTVLSGWLTDRYDSRLLLGGYYALRGLSLLILPWLIAASVRPSMLVFIVFYGLDWVATVPPTIALCRQHFGADGPIVFGWVFAAHQFGAAVAATGAGVLRDVSGDYNSAWIAAGLLCFFAAVMSVRIMPSADAAKTGPVPVRTNVSRPV
jgi:predicted MFS family arabinose efflux permease